MQEDLMGCDEISHTYNWLMLIPDYVIYTLIRRRNLSYFSPKSLIISLTCSLQIITCEGFFEIAF